MSQLEHLERFLENEQRTNSTEPWGKLDKTARLRKLQSFADLYKQEQSLTEEEHQLLVLFFKDCLDKKKLCRVKDVVCNKETGEIKSIPSLSHNRQTNHFTLKNLDAKYVSTVKGLAPKKKGTVRKTHKEMLEPLATKIEL